LRGVLKTASRKQEKRGKLKFLSKWTKARKVKKTGGGAAKNGPGGVVMGRIPPKESPTFQGKKKPTTRTGAAPGGNLKDKNRFSWGGKLG